MALHDINHIKHSYTPSFLIWWHKWRERSLIPSPHTRSVLPAPIICKIDFLVKWCWCDCFIASSNIKTAIRSKVCAACIQACSKLPDKSGLQIADCYYHRDFNVVTQKKTFEWKGQGGKNAWLTLMCAITRTLKSELSPQSQHRLKNVDVGKHDDRRKWNMDDTGTTKWPFCFAILIEMGHRFIR